MEETDQAVHWVRTPIGVASILFTGIAGALLIGYVLLLQWDYEIIYHNLEPEDAARIVSELEQQETHYKLSDHGSTIQVPARQASAIRLKVSESVSPSNSLVGFELFNESEMGLTDFAQKIKYQRALQGELARTIMMIDGIKNARVHIAVPEQALFRSEQIAPSAAITLHTEKPTKPDDPRIDGIREIVAASVPNLSLTNVVIMDARGNIIGIERSGGPSSAINTEQIQERDLGASASSNEANQELAQQLPEPDPPAPRTTKAASTPGPQLQTTTSTFFFISIVSLILVFCLLLARKWFIASLPIDEHERFSSQLTTLLQPTGSLQNDA